MLRPGICRGEDAICRIDTIQISSLATLPATCALEARYYAQFRYDPAEILLASEIFVFQISVTNYSLFGRNMRWR